MPRVLSQTDVTDFRERLCDAAERLFAHALPNFMGVIPVAKPALNQCPVHLDDQTVGMVKIQPELCGDVLRVFFVIRSLKSPFPEQGGGTLHVLPFHQQIHIAKNAKAQIAIGLVGQGGALEGYGFDARFLEQL